MAAAGRSACAPGQWIQTRYLASSSDVRRRIVVKGPTNADEVLDFCLGPLDEITALAAANLKDLACSARRSTHATTGRAEQCARELALRHNRVRLTDNEHTLDPVVEILETDNW